MSNLPIYTIPCANPKFPHAYEARCRECGAIGQALVKWKLIPFAEDHQCCESHSHCRECGVPLPPERKVLCGKHMAEAAGIRINWRAAEATAHPELSDLEWAQDAPQPRRRGNRG